MDCAFSSTNITNHRVADDFIRQQPEYKWILSNKEVAISTSYSDIILPRPPPEPRFKPPSPASSLRIPLTRPSSVKRVLDKLNRLSPQKSTEYLGNDIAYGQQLQQQQYQQHQHQQQQQQQYQQHQHQQQQQQQYQKHQHQQQQQQQYQQHQHQQYQQHQQQQQQQQNQQHQQQPCIEKDFESIHDVLNTKQLKDEDASNIVDSSSAIHKTPRNRTTKMNKHQSSLMVITTAPKSYQVIAKEKPKNDRGLESSVRSEGISLNPKNINVLITCVGSSNIKRNGNYNGHTDSTYDSFVNDNESHPISSQNIPNQQLLNTKQSENVTTTTPQPTTCYVPDCTTKIYCMENEGTKERDNGQSVLLSNASDIMISPQTVNSRRPLKVSFQTESSRSNLNKSIECNHNSNIIQESTAKEKLSKHSSIYQLKNNSSFISDESIIIPIDSNDNKDDDDNDDNDDVLSITNLSLNFDYDNCNSRPNNQHDIDNDENNNDDSDEKCTKCGEKSFNLGQTMMINSHPLIIPTGCFQSNLDVEGSSLLFKENISKKINSRRSNENQIRSERKKSSAVVTFDDVRFAQKERNRQVHSRTSSTSKKQYRAQSSKLPRHNDNDSVIVQNQNKQPRSHSAKPSLRRRKSASKLDPNRNLKSSNKSKSPNRKTIATSIIMYSGVPYDNQSEQTSTNTKLCNTSSSQGNNNDMTVPSNRENYNATQTRMNQRSPETAPSTPPSFKSQTQAQANNSGYDAKVEKSTFYLHSRGHSFTRTSQHMKHHGKVLSTLNVHYSQTNTGYNDRIIFADLLKSAHTSNAVIGDSVYTMERRLYNKRQDPNRCTTFYDRFARTTMTKSNSASKKQRYRYLLHGNTRTTSSASEDNNNDNNIPIAGKNAQNSNNNNNNNNDNSNDNNYHDNTLLITRENNKDESQSHTKHRSNLRNTHSVKYEAFSKKTCKSNSKNPTAAISSKRSSSKARTPNSRTVAGKEQARKERIQVKKERIEKGYIPTMNSLKTVDSNDIDHILNCCKYLRVTPDRQPWLYGSGVNM